MDASSMNNEQRLPDTNVLNKNTHIEVHEDVSSNTSTAAIADVLLAMVKDGRYLSSLVHLLSQTVSPWLVPYRSQNRHMYIDNASNINILRPELELIAGMIHFLLTVLPIGRTLGMEYVGIDFDSENKNVQNRVGRDNDNTQQNTARKNDLSQNKVRKRHANKSQSDSSYSAFLTKFGGSRANMIAFSFIYVFAPYLIRRAGRRGWIQLQQLYNSFSQRRQGNNVLGQETGSQRNENLRGIDRRRVYEEQRRAMLARIEAMENQQRQPQQPQQQITTTNQESNHAHVPSNNEATYDWNSFFNENIRSILTTARRMIWSLLQTLSTIENEHHNESNSIFSITVNPTENNEQISIPNRNQYTSILKWILRLHLALFYLNSKYPTILTHRFLSLKFKRERPSSFPVRFNNSMRPSYRILGMLLLLQNTGSLVKGTANIIMETFYRIQMYKMRRQRSTHIVRQSNEDSAYEHEGSFLRSVERIVPSLISFQNTIPCELLPSSNFIARTNNSDVTVSMSCPLCMGERKAPSIAPCGHIFCWKCLQHWCANKRPECPLCRNPCPPQKVIALYGYS